MSKEVENIERLMQNKSVEFRDFKITGTEKRSVENGKEQFVISGVPCVFDTETVL